ncbi:MAG: TlpA family protein disulfide reductase [Bacteroidetes bacterium]|nr:TlpA family protein disulfide reductase [Bacteroidota bacterium]
MIDSARTDAKGDFVIKGNLKEMLFCQLQWSETGSLLLAVDNNTQARLQIDGEGASMRYSLEGKGIEASSELKELMDLNTSYGLQLQRLEQQAQTIPNTAEGYQQAEALQKQYYGLLAERTKNIREFSVSRKKSFIPYFILMFGLLESPDVEMFAKGVESARALNPNSQYTRDLTARYETEKRIGIGAVAPEINLSQPDGKTLALSSLKGKYVLIDFWASWCGPCRRENPFNVNLYKKFHPKGFEVYGVSLDDDAGKWRSAIAKDSLTWYHVSDLGGWGSSAAKLYQVKSIPATYLLDKEGKIIAKGLRGEQLQAKLEELLGK